jgi:superfamily I DNA and RNA helicase
LFLESVHYQALVEYESITLANIHMITLFVAFTPHVPNRVSSKVENHSHLNVHCWVLAMSMYQKFPFTSPWVKQTFLSIISIVQDLNIEKKFIDKNKRSHSQSHVFNYKQFFLSSWRVYGWDILSMNDFICDHCCKMSCV